MKKLNYFIALGILLMNINLVYSQENPEFKPSGKIIARAFLDYSTDFDSENGFDLKRAFLGYNYKINPTLQATVIIDGASGKNSEGNLQPYIRNAFINWKDQGFNVNVGLTGLLQFSIQEKYWMHRYVEKTFQDLNSVAPSVDLGFTAQYEISPMLSVDLSITNGEGYKRIKSDNNMRYALGVSFRPTESMILRVYGDYYNKSKDNTSIVEREDQQSLSVFAGYQKDPISFGAEYNHQFNRGFIDGRDFYGYSVYSSVKVAEKWRTFARYDLADSSDPSTATAPWSTIDGQLLMIGIEFQPLKQIKIAPNFRNLNHDGRDSEQYLFINAEFDL